MKRKVLIVGIGAGNPEHVTVQAIAALNAANVVFIPTKGSEKADLAELRREICARFVTGDKPSRLVEFEVPTRDAANPDYEAGVGDWHDAVQQAYERLLGEELREGETGAFLAWGDPALYDSVLRIFERIAAKGALDLDYDVVPGISSVQALAAAHRLPLNRIGESVLITTGRKLAEGFPDTADSVVVMLDGQSAFGSVDPDTEIYWGAYLGTPDEILVAGRLGDVADEIERARREARARKGWIMDTYLLRKPRKD
jgi:precorrin-6A synthase